MFTSKILLFVTLKGIRYFYLTVLILAMLILLNIAIIAQFGKSPLEGKSIIIDPGHGGVDGGTNDGSSFLEKDVNLQIALKLQQVLEAEKAAVKLTRYEDVSLDSQNNQSPSRHTRDLIARTAQFNSGRYDIFISIHVNRAKTSRAIGPMVLYWTKDERNSILATCLQDNLNRHSEANLGKTAIHSPVKYNYFILRNSKIPGAIVETGFISNPTEKRLLKDESYQLKLCNAICDGIKDYFYMINEGGRDFVNFEENES